MQGYITHLPTSYFGRRFFGIRYFALPVLATGGNRSEAATKDRSASAVAFSRSVDATPRTRSAEALSMVRTVDAPPNNRDLAAKVPVRDA